MRPRIGLTLLALTALCHDGLTHGTVVSPPSRVYNVFQSNPENPNFPLAANAVVLDGTLSYYTWNEVSRNIPDAVTGGLPAGFDYSPWIPDGELASAGRTDPNSPDYSNTFAGLDQASADWPTTPVTAGETILVDYFATAPHNPSVWDVWMTKPGWDPNTPLTWGEMEFLGRPNVAFDGSNYTFDLTIPTDRSGHHVLWVAWQRDDPVGEVFISASDLDIANASPFEDVGNGLAGTSGVPSLLGEGMLQAGDPVALLLTDAAASALTTLVIGVSQINARFKGGVLVPAPTTLLSGLATDAAGELTLASTWPPGVPPAADIWFQHWIVDTAGVQGFSASNGLRATTP